MHDPLPVRLVQRIRDLNCNGQCSIWRQRSLLDPLGQRLAFQVLHHEEVDTALLADIEDRANVGMAEGRDRLGLALETLLQFRIGRNVLGAGP